MRKTSFFTSLFVVASLVDSASYAAENLSWESCVREVQQKNESYRSGKQSVAAANYLSKVARGEYLPTLSGNLSYQYSDQTDSTYSAGLQISQNLFAGLRDQGGIAQAAAREAQEMQRFRATRAQVSYDLKRAYEGLLYAQNNQTLIQDIIRRREDNMRLVSLRYETGRENKGSVLLSQAYFSQAKYERLQADFAVQVAQAQLSAVLGRPPGGDLVVFENIPESVPEVIPDYLNIVRQTPELKIIQAQKEEAHAGVKVARSTFFPRLDVAGGFSSQDDTFFPQNDTWTATASLTFPFFNGTKDYYSLKTAQTLFSVASHDERSVFLRLFPKLKQAHASFVQSIEKLNVDLAFIEATKARSEIARSKYNNGLLSFEDWDIIENDLISRQKSYLLSKLDRVIGQASWEQTKGEAVFP